MDCPPKKEMRSIFTRLRTMEALSLTPPLLRRDPHFPAVHRRPRFPQLSTCRPVAARAARIESPAAASKPRAFPLPGAEEAVVGFITGKRRATEVAHSVWKNIIQKGDTVVDATCGNGHDTLAMLKMIADGSGRGCVYGMDIQPSALEGTASLIEESVTANERELVKLFLLCHSKMEDIVPRDKPVRLITFNLGYLPGGDKAIITLSSTTFMALQAASRILHSGGLISMVVYVGHPGGREELETVQSFASSLPADTWVSCKLEMLNRPTSPVLVFFYKK